jgi:hypothetical protein
VLVLVPVFLVYAAPLPPTDGPSLLEYINDYRLNYMVQLICFVGLAIPGLLLFAALAVALRRVDYSIAALGGLFGVVSEVVSLALAGSPQSLHAGLVVLAGEYEGAGDGRRAALGAAADALIAMTNAVSWAGVVTAAAILLLSSLMRRGGFGSRLATFGIITGVLGILSEAFRTTIGPAFVVYGLLLPIWFAWVGFHLLRVARATEGTSSAH